MTAPRTAYVELVAASNFSFLHGASHGCDLVAEALRLGHAGIGIADRNTVAGVVRAWSALKQARLEAEANGVEVPPFKLVTGARLVFADGTPDIVAYPATRHGWGRLCRLLSQGNLRADKGDCVLRFDDLLAHLDDLLLIVLPESTLRAGEGSERKPEDQTGLPEDSLPPCGGGLGRGDRAAGLDARLLEFPSEALASSPPLPNPASGERRVDHAPGMICGMPGAFHTRRAPDTPTRGEGLESGNVVAFPSVQRPPLDRVLATLRAAAPKRVWLGAAMHRAGPDRRRLVRLRQIAGQTGVALIAINDVLYAKAEDRPLQDVLTCIRLGTTIAEAGRRLEANAERHLKPPEEMARLFRDCPETIAEALRFHACIQFDLEELKYEYPHEPVPKGWLPLKWLKRLVGRAAARHWPAGMPERARKMLAEEWKLIGARPDLPYYFLTVHDLVRFARSKGILCQGRGSAANSMVCYLLDVTSVDPVEHDLLFSRFMSEDRNEPPDIDVDFEHERREEVMQYVYERYGRHRAGIVATVIHYRSRSTVREVGKALGLTEDVTTRLVSTVWGSYSSVMEEERFKETGFALDNPEIARLHHFVALLLGHDREEGRQTSGFPRHLSQHVGGYVLTQHRLDETVPIHHAAMEDRTFIEWDKDDIDALGLMKVDVLALGMLTCIRKAFDMLRDYDGTDYTLKTLPPEQADVYDMLQTGDSIGVFQVESRAQMNMLPRLKPRIFYDLVVQVAIVRPGPIQGDMVHPYLRRRAGIEEWNFPSPAPPHPPDELHAILGKTLGVPLFQEQAMKLAITAASFSGAQANKFRRAMATFRNVGTMPQFEKDLVGGMVKRGYTEEFARRCFDQIKGFGSYGFPESHALSFALLVYASAYLKKRHPAAFCAALLNSQPMGFYAPAQIVGCARKHGVEIRPIDAAHSHWDNILETGTNGPAVRLGFRQIDGFREKWAERIMERRGAAKGVTPAQRVEALAHAARLPSRALRLLADADAFRAFGYDRREGLWEVRRTPHNALPLFAAADARELGQEADPELPVMPLSEHVAADYQTTRLSLKQHPMAFLRDLFDGEGITRAGDLATLKDGARAKVAGVVLVRQRPGTGNAIFVTLEDETGVANLLLWARDFERNRRNVMAARLMVAEGVVQVVDETLDNGAVIRVAHLMTTRVHDRTAELDRLSEDHETRQPLSRADEFTHPNYRPQGWGGRGHPRDVRIMPPSRDFH